jgi:hypothetical protein
VLLVQELLRIFFTINFVFNSDRHLTVIVLGLLLLACLVFFFKVFNLVYIHMTFVLISGSTPLTPALKLFFSFLIGL